MDYNVFIHRLRCLHAQLLDSGCFLSSIMCHKSYIRGSGVKKHHISKTFPRKVRENSLLLLLADLCFLSEQDLMTYILKRRHEKACSASFPLHTLSEIPPLLLLTRQS